MCDVAAAAVVTNTHTACVVSYNASTDLAATSHRLGIPVVIQHGFKYCYDLPQATAASAKQQHCQVWLLTTLCRPYSCASLASHIVM